MIAAVDPIATIAELVATGPRRAGSHGEWRAARRLQDRLRAMGREAELEPFRARAQWWWPTSLNAALAVVGSLVSVSAPRAGLAIALAAFVSALGDLEGRVYLLRRLVPARASQNVVSPPPRERSMRLVIAARYDTGRGGLVYHDLVRAPLARLATWLARGLPGPRGWLVVAIAATASGAPGGSPARRGPAWGRCRRFPPWR